MVNDTLLCPCEQESADEGEIFMVFEKENKLRNSMPHFSLMFHRGSNSTVKVKMFVPNVLEQQNLPRFVEKGWMKQAVADKLPVISKCGKLADISHHHSLMM